MKTKIFILFLLAFNLSVLAQVNEPQTLFSKDVQFGYSGALVTKVSKINDETALLTGMRGAFLLDHSYSVGLGFYGLLNNMNALNPNPNTLGSNRLGMFYGGLELEYILTPNNLVHVSFQSLVGAGGVGYWDGWDHNHHKSDLNNYYEDDHFSKPDGFFIIEPGVNIELNVVDFFKIGAGASYRLVSGLTSTASTNAKLSGFSGFLTLNFGKF